MIRRYTKIAPAIFFLLVVFFLLQCKSSLIKEHPLSFSQWRVDETIKYVQTHYGRTITSLEMLPVMVVAHYTAMDSTEVSFNYMNKEEMESGRSLLKKAGLNNIAVHFLVANRHAIGIENVGKDESALTMAQVNANAYIVRELVKKYPIRYLIAHSEYRTFENTPLWEEKDKSYRTPKIDPGESFMQPLRAQLADLNLSAAYDGSEIPDRIDDTLKKYFVRKEFEGSVLVIRHGKIIFQKIYGDIPPQKSFYLASAAKSITATLVHKLIAQKKIRLNTPVVRYFPELKHLLKGVEVRHLLAHTSGLEDYYRLEGVEPGFTNTDVLRLLQTQKKPLMKAGKKFHYSNSNYVLLALVVEKITGQKFEEVAHAKIFTPLKMIHTFFASETTRDKDKISAINAAEKYFDYPYKTTGAGGLYTTAEDMARFDEALLNNTLMLRPQFIAMLRPQARVEKKNTEYAFGWYVYPQRGILYHDGNFNGYHTMNWLDIKNNSAIILLSSRQTQAIQDITFELDSILNGIAAEK
ncbi:MAG TPA: serine hydrolase [Turneriella sp.]|nr:serine hydrolase [Turneriella sp.]